MAKFSAALTDDQKEIVFSRFLNGESIALIAYDLGVSERTIQRMVAGTRSRKGTYRFWKWTPEQDTILAECVAQNISLDVIAAKIGCNRAQAYRRCKNRNLELPESRSAPLAGAAITNDHYWSRKTMERMNANFVKAVRRAHPNIAVGVCTKPCTSKPILSIIRSQPATKSALADIG